MHFLTIDILGIPTSDWLKFILITIGIFLPIALTKAILVKKLAAAAKRSKNNMDDILLKIIEQTRIPLVFLAGIYGGSQALILPDTWVSTTQKIFFVIAALQVGLWMGGVINHLVTFREKKEANDKEGQTAVRAFGLFGKIIIWCIVGILTIQNVTGMKMDALVTSLGIGGIAVGLAVQNILKDLFSSLSIFMDKPFLVGDYIVVGDIGGTVQNIGLKSTRIKTLLGEEVIFSNSNILDSQIHNFRKLERRMVVTNIGVSTQTPHDVLQSLPALFENIIRAQGNVTFDRANLAEFGDYTYNFEIVYHIESPDYTLFMNIKEAIYLEIIKQLQEKQVDMPYPTRTVFLNKSDPSTS